MQRFEYKVVPAPTRAKRVRGVKTAAGRFAVALGEVINEQAADGWDYVRSDSMPVEEKPGLLKSTVENYYTMLVFRRPTDTPATDAPAIPVAAPAVPVPAAVPPVEPAVDPVVEPVVADYADPVLNPPGGGNTDFPADPPMTAPPAEPPAPVQGNDDNPFAEPTDTEDQIIR